MSLSSNMWTSVTGLLTHGEKMNVIGNNLANVSTIGFKAQRADFADFFYTDYGSMNGQTQVGKGTAVAALIGDFSQGGFENTNSGTDLAIDGSGFFRVRNQDNGGTFYTRAGDFFFDDERQLVNPAGLVLQGWSVSDEKSVSISAGESVGQSSFKPEIRRTGLVKDIVLDQWNLAPQRTRNVTIANNLINDDMYDVCKSTTSPLTSLFDAWNAKNATPLADDQYATQSTIAAYDEGGRAHTLTVYMDKVNTNLLNADSSEALYNLSNLPAGYSVYEYLVTMDPKEDMRSSSGDEGTAFYDPTQGTEEDPKAGIQTKAGVLMSGVMIFDASGTLVNQSAYTYNGSNAGGEEGVDFSANKANWTPTAFSNHGLPVFAANFSGKANASTVFAEDGTPNVAANESVIELDLGLNTTSTMDPWQIGAYGTPAEIGDNSLASLAAGDDGTVDVNNLALMASMQADENATANNATTFITDIQDDGYTSGRLSNYKIDADGIVYGYYDNGENVPLYQIAMYDFHSTQGLRREGGNLYSPTRESGDPVEGVAGHGSFGTISSYYIENSNVDMSREFVHMISCQRGFQANSKSITTTDTMLETVIGMKR